MSSLVKACLPTFRDEGLRLVEVNKGFRGFPISQAVCFGILPVNGQRSGFLQGRGHATGVTDRLDHVGRRVGNAVQDNGIAHTLDSRRGDDPLPLDADRLRSPLPEGIDDGLNVLLVHHQSVVGRQIGRASCRERV